MADDVDEASDLDDEQYEMAGAAELIAPAAATCHHDMPLVYQEEFSDDELFDNEEVRAYSMLSVPGAALSDSEEEQVVYNNSHSMARPLDVVRPDFPRE